MDLKSKYSSLQSVQFTSRTWPPGRADQWRPSAEAAARGPSLSGRLRRAVAASRPPAGSAAPRGRAAVGRRTRPAPKPARVVALLAPLLSAPAARPRGCARSRRRGRTGIESSGAVRELRLIGATKASRGQMTRRAAALIRSMAVGAAAATAAAMAAVRSSPQAAYSRP